MHLPVISLVTITMYARTLTLSKLSGQVEEARSPSLFSFLPISSPSVSRSTMKQVMPLYPCQTKVTLYLPFCHRGTHLITTKHAIYRAWVL